MDDKKKRRSPKPCLSQPAPPSSSLRRVPVPTSRSASFSLGLPHLPSPKQRSKFKRVTKEKCRPVLAGGGGAPAGTPLQHCFLTEVTGVYEMEGGLLNLLNDFHSGRLQAFGRSLRGAGKEEGDLVGPASGESGNELSFRNQDRNITSLRAGIILLNR